MLMPRASAAPCAPSTAMRDGFACTFHGHRYGEFHELFFLNGSLLPVCAEWSWSDPDLTLGAPRGGGEVGITEAERSDRISPGGMGYRVGIAARSVRMGGRWVVQLIRGYCAGSVWFTTLCYCNSCYVDLAPYY
jgi:hypothetical protein